MKRSLKALGLALVAALALSAIAAAGASAEEGKEASFWAAEDAVKIDATGEGTHEFNAGGRVFQCHEENETSAVHGTATYTEETKALTSENVEYTNCTAPGPFGSNFPVTVDMNECDYVFTAGTYTKEITPGVDGSDGSVHIECPENKEITITVFKASSEPPHPEADLRCTIHVPPQKAKGSVTFHNITTEGGVMAVTGISHAKVESVQTDANTIVCPEEVVDPEAEYTGNLIAKATNNLEEYVDHTVTETVL